MLFMDISFITLVSNACLVQCEKHVAYREMLNHREFSKNFCFVHFYHSLIDFGPVRDAGDVVEGWAMFVKGTSLHLAISCDVPRR